MRSPATAKLSSGGGGRFTFSPDEDEDGKDNWGDASWGESSAPVRSAGLSAVKPKKKGMSLSGAKKVGKRGLGAMVL